METMPSSFVGAPRTQTSHVRTSSHSSEAHNIPQPATRAAFAVISNPHVPDSAPASQESSLSGMSAATSSTRAQLHASSSNLSQLTSYSDDTSHAAAASSLPGGAKTFAGLLHEPSSRAADLSRARSPDETSGLSSSGHGRDEYAIGSPMSIASPVFATNGTKRTASGHVKNTPSLSSSATTVHWDRRRSRADSISSSGSRAGELAASLKTRLGYAMAKVQHGWEHKNIAEVEQLAAQKMSPHRRSMSHVDQNGVAPWTTSSRTNGTSNVHYSHARVHPEHHASPPSKRHSVSLAPLHTHQQQHQHQQNASSYTHGHAPLLQPPADIDSTPRQSRHRHTPSQSQSTTATIMSPPRTPVSNTHHPRRPPTIRTETQTAEAERDALQALFQLGSPHNSQVSRHTASAASQASSSQEQMSPSERADFSAIDASSTPRRRGTGGFMRSESDASAVSGLSGGGEGLRAESRVRGRAMAEA